MLTKLRATIFLYFLNKFISNNDITLLHTINRGDSQDITGKDISRMLTLNERFLRIIAIQESNKYFVKIPLTRKGERDLKKQIEITKYLTKEAGVHTPKIFKSNVNFLSPIKYAFFEYLPLDVHEGFFYNAEYNTKFSRIKYKRITQKHINLVIKELYEFVSTPRASVPTSIKPIKYVDYKAAKRIYEKNLDKKVKPVEEKPKEIKLSALLNEKLKVKDFRSEFFGLLDYIKSNIQKYEYKDKYYLTHGDFDFNNVYFLSKDKLKFIDFEFMGYSRSPIWSFAYDYGNLRARQWANKNFRLSLDNAMLDFFRSQNKGEMGKLILTLAIIKRSFEFTTIFENYPYEKQSKEFEKIRKRQLIDDLRIALSMWHR